MPPQLVQAGCRTFLLLYSRNLAGLGVIQIKVRLEMILAEDSGNIRAAKMVSAACLPLVFRQGTGIDLDIRTLIVVRVTESNCFRGRHCHRLIVEVFCVFRLDFPIRKMLSATGARFVCAVIACHGEQTPFIVDVFSGSDRTEELLRLKA